MTTDAVVKHFHVLEYLSFRLLTSVEHLIRRDLALQTTEERFHGSVVPTLTHLTHTACDPLRGQHTLVVIAGILAPAIRMRQQARKRTTTMVYGGPQKL